MIQALAARGQGLVLGLERDNAAAVEVTNRVKATDRIRDAVHARIRDTIRVYSEPYSDPDPNLL